MIKLIKEDANLDAVKSICHYVLANQFSLMDLKMAEETFSEINNCYYDLSSKFDEVDSQYYNCTLPNGRPAKTYKLDVQNSDLASISVTISGDWDDRDDAVILSIGAIKSDDTSDLEFSRTYHFLDEFENVCYKANNIADLFNNEMKSREFIDLADKFGLEQG